MGRIASFVRGLMQRKPALANFVEARACIVATGRVARHIEKNGPSYTPDIALPASD